VDDGTPGVDGGTPGVDGGTTGGSGRRGQNRWCGRCGSRGRNRWCGRPTGYARTGHGSPVRSPQRPIQHASTTGTGLFTKQMVWKANRLH
jgi:hypothetical protein